MPKKSKDAEPLRLASTNANTNTAKSDSPSQATGDKMDDLPLISEKVSDKILKHINDRFDKLEQTLQAVQLSQKELLEKVESIEEQVLEQENRISCLKKVLSGLKNENNTFKLKVDDLEGWSRHNNIKIVGIPEQAEEGKPTRL